MAKVIKEREPTNACVPIELIEALRWPKPPAEIWQKPFDYYPGHCERISDPSEPINLFDFCDYFLDYQYMEVQRDLFLYAFPKALEAWARRELKMRDKQRFKGDWHFEGMWDAVATRPVHPGLLTDQQYEAMKVFLVRVLTTLMQKENALSFKGSDASPYAWTQLHATLIYLFPVAETVWKAWWSYPSTQMATCGVQWLSTLFYESHENPFFDPWTGSSGGGPPLIFETSLMRYKPANSENLEFLRSTLTKDWAFDAITRAKVALEESPRAEKVQEMLDDFPWRSVLFEERIQKFFTVLEAKDSWTMVDWDAIKA